MLRLILGAAGSGKTRRVCEEIRDGMRGRDGMVLLTPEQQSHRAERRLAAVCGPALSLHGEVLSFTRMYNRAALEIGGLADPLPDKGGRLLMMALALEEAGPKLTCFRERGKRTDFLRRLMTTAEELRGSMTTAAELLAAAEKTPSAAVRGKLTDMALVLEAWEAVQKRSLGDSRDAVARLAEGIAGCGVGAGGVWADGFTDFTAEELAVLEGILRRGTDLTVTLPLGEGENACFAVAEGAFRSLTELARRRGAEVVLERLPDPPADPIRYLAANLYEYEAPPLPAGEKPVELCKMASFRGECRWATARIRELMLADGSLRYSDFAVAVPGFASRRAAAESVFRAYGLPVFVEEASPLLPSASAVFLLEALRTVTEGWRAGNLFRCLKTGLGGLTAGETDELENYCLTWELRGESVWRREEAWDLSPRGYDARPEEDREALERIDALRRRVAAPFGRLGDALKNPAPAGDHLRALSAFLEETGVREALIARADALEKGGDAAAASACAGAWNAAADCLREMDALLGGVTLAGEEFTRLLELLLREREVGSIPAALDCVSLGSPARLRDRKPRVLLVLGADEEHLPEETGSRGLFSPEELRILFDLGIRLTADRDDALTRPLLELYLLAASPAERLLVSWSGGEDARPGILAERARTLLGLVPETEESLAGRQLAAAAAPLLELALGKGPWAEAARACLPPGRPEELRAFAAQAHTSLLPETAEKLYGRTLRLTPSRVESFYKCSYRYFLEYGLRAKERKAARFSAPENGTFLHYLLENVCRRVRDEGGFAAVTEERLRALTAEYAERFGRETFKPAQLRDKRFLYLFRRLSLRAEEIVLQLAEQLAAGDFEPLDFELRFSDRDGDLPALELGDLRLEGTVDRVDGWRNGNDLYLCVADYKSGEKQFSLAEVYRGTELQMPVYLFMLTTLGKDRYQTGIVPGGVLYLPARQAQANLPRSSTEEEIRDERYRKAKVTGLLLKDVPMLRARDRSEPPRFLPVKFKDGLPISGAATGPQMRLLEAHVRRLLTGMGEDLRRGEAAADPLFTTKDKGPCSYCPFGDICGFDPKKTKPRLIGTLKEDEFWAAVGKEKERG